MDEQPADSTTYYLYRDATRAYLKSLRSCSPFSITFLTLGSGVLNMIAHSVRCQDFTPDIWYRRATPEQRVTLTSNTEMSCKGYRQVVLLVADPEEASKALSPIFESCKETMDLFIFSVYNSHGDERDYNYPECVHRETRRFKTLQELDLWVRPVLVPTKRRKGIYCVKCIHFETFYMDHGIDWSFSQKLSKDHNRNLALFYSNTFWKALTTWSNVKARCSALKMSLLTVRNEKELARISAAIAANLHSLSTRMAERGFDKKLDMVFRLRKTSNQMGHMYSWDKDRDLLFSHWAAGEPRNIFNKICVRWRFEYDGHKWVDRKWHTSSCKVDALTIITTLCEQRLPPSDKALVYTHDHDGQSSDLTLKRMLGRQIFYKTKGRRVLVSMSSALSSGYLYKNWTALHEMDILVLVSDDLATLTPGHRYLLEQLRFMFHKCEYDQDSLSDQPWGVPLSLVCDGKRDCHSGSDEASCGYTGEKICNQNEFQCKSRQCVPLEARCDLLPDCQDGSDEAECDLECRHKECKSGQCLPKSWFHDGVMDCKDGEDEVGDSPVDDTCVFICNRTECVTKAMLNNSIVDCTGPEGPLDETIGSLEPFICTAVDNNTNYFNKWAPKCVLARDLFGQIIGCRDFQHLSHCESFKCPKGYVKCPDSFCIPLVNVKDGKEECDEGEDEGMDPLPDLENIFQCNPWKHQAVPLSAVCDGRRDCRHGEDELDCGDHCPLGFICLAGAVSAGRYNKTQPLRNISFIHPATRYLDLSGVLGVHDFFSIFPKHHLRYLLSLMLSKCQIRSLSRKISDGQNSARKKNEDLCGSGTTLEDFAMVRTVDLSHNDISTLPSCSYINLMSNVENMNLTFNVRLSILSRESFTNLKRLKILDLSFTGLTRLAHDVWDDLESLQALSLKGTRLISIKFILPATIEYLNVELTTIADVGERVFSKVDRMKELRSSSYKLCCPRVLGQRISRHICSFTDRAISSCHELIIEPALKVIVWVIGLATLVGNAITLLYRFTWDRKVLEKPYGIFVTNLAVADLLMGVYLVTIAIADALFYGEYVLHDYTWRHSPVCQAAGVLVTMSSLASMIFIFLITVERYLAVRYPFGEVRLVGRTVNILTFGAWVFSLTAALLPLMPFAERWKVFSLNGMCVALPLSNERRPGHWYGATLFVGIDLILFLFIGVGQGIIYKTVKEKGIQTRKHTNPQSQLHQNQRIQEFRVAKQLSLVVITDFLCWFPIITMGLMALSGVDLGAAAYRWSALLVLPLNSSLNPALYTVPEIRKSLADYREARRMQAKRMKVKVATSRQRRLRNKLIAKGVSGRRGLALRSFHALVKIRQEMLARPKPSQRARANLGILYIKVVRLKLIICNK